MSVADAGTEELSVHLPDAQATRDLGSALAAAALPGMVVLLDGPLGAGKTTLVQGFAQAIGSAQAASPTFVLAHHYAGGRMPVWHLDLYRIEGPAEIEDLDIDQYLPADGVALVEWAGRAPDAWPHDRLEILLSMDGRGRRALLRGRCRSAAVVRSLAADGTRA